MRFERVHDVEWKSESQIQSVIDAYPDHSFTARAVIQLIQYDNWLVPQFALLWEIEHFSRGTYLGQTHKHIGDFDSFKEAAVKADDIYRRRFTKEYLDLALPENVKQSYAA